MENLRIWGILVILRPESMLIINGLRKISLRKITGNIFAGIREIFHGEKGTTRPDEGCH